MSSMVATARAVSGGAADADSPSGGIGTENCRQQDAAERGLAIVRADLHSACDLLSVMCHADGVVRATACQPDIVHKLMSLAEEFPAGLLAQLFSSLQLLSSEPTAVRRLQEARTVPLLVSLLRRSETASGVKITMTVQLQILEVRNRSSLCSLMPFRRFE